MSDKQVKFKVGDKVRRVSHSYDEMVVGSTWIVKEVHKWGDTIRVEGLGGCWWNKNDFELVSEENVLKRTLTNSGDGGVVCEQSGSITSDGGSSSYYFTKLPKHLIDQIVETGGIEIKDIIRYVFDNDADAFNIVKAQKRIVESNKGKGKAGITPLYDAKKITFFANEQYEAMKNKESK